MALQEKLSLLNLNADQEQIVKEKFLATLSLVSEEDIKDIIAYLNEHGIMISKAREVKILANPREELTKKFSILGELHETKIYTQEPTMLNKNVIDLYRRLQYCRQNGIEYKDEEGKYKSFLFSESSWQQEISKSPIEPAKVSTEQPVDIVTIEPETNDNIINFEDYMGFSEDEPVSDVSETQSSDIVDINEYRQNLAESVEEVLDMKTANFASIKEELKAALADLDAAKNGEISELSFNDIQPETFGLGRVA